MRIFIAVLTFQPYHVKKFHYSVDTVSLVHFLINVQRLCNDLLYKPSGIQRPERILEYYLDILLKGVVTLLFLAENRLSFKEYLAVSRRIKSEYGIHESGLAAARFTNDTESLALFKLEGYTVNSLKGLVLDLLDLIIDIKVFLQILYIKQYLVGLYRFFFLGRIKAGVDKHLRILFLGIAYYRQGLPFFDDL